MAYGVYGTTVATCELSGGSRGTMRVAVVVEVILMVLWLGCGFCAGAGKRLALVIGNRT